MRIALVTDWFAPRRGGIESQLVRLAQELAGRGHEVHVITSTRGGEGADSYVVKRLHLLMLPGARISISPRLISTLKGELRDRYDVVHAHISVVSPVGYAGLYAARTLGLPVVATFHSVLHAKRAMLSAASALFGIAHSPIVWTGVSQLVAAQLGSALRLPRPVDVLPNGIDFAFWNGNGPEDGRSREVVTLVSAMRLHRKKRPRALVAAFRAAARRAGVPARLLIAGIGPEERNVLDDIARGPADDATAVRLVGWKSPDELRDLYLASDGFAIASRNESFGIATLEARAAGLPVIAMRAAGSGEFLDDAQDALLCDNDDALVEALARFIADADLRKRMRMSNASLARYDWANVIARHHDAYEKALALGTASAGAGGR